MDNNFRLEDTRHIEEWQQRNNLMYTQGRTRHTEEDSNEGISCS